MTDSDTTRRTEVAGGFRIRPYRRSDRQAVRDICVATCWMGQYRPEMIPDDWIWAEYWTRYFTDRQWQLTWVVENCADGRVVGYLTGTDDVAKVERYVPFLLPGIVLHAIRHRLVRKPASRRAIATMLGSMFKGELDLPPGVGRHFPATLHMDLLGEARRGGVGGRLFRVFVRRLQQLGVPGVHGQVLSINEPIRRFLAGLHLRMIASTPTSAYRHICPDPIEIETWVMPL